MSEYYGFDVGSGYAFQAPGWKQSDFLLCDLQEVVRQSDQAMVDALQRVRRLYSNRILQQKCQKKAILERRRGCLSLRQEPYCRTDQRCPGIEIKR